MDKTRLYVIGSAHRAFSHLYAISDEGVVYIAVSQEGWHLSCSTPLEEWRWGRYHSQKRVPAWVTKEYASAVIDLDDEGRLLGSWTIKDGELRCEEPEIAKATTHHFPRFSYSYAEEAGVTA